MFINRFLPVIGLLLLFTVSALASPFGRFGYHNQVRIPDFELTPSALKLPGSDREPLSFWTPLPAWRAIDTQPTEQVIGFGLPEFGPSKARVSLLSPGVDLYFPKGVRFRLRSIAAPYLTWSEGSVTTGVPTPAVAWVVVSFPIGQPPITIGVPGGARAWTVTGQPGNWVLASDDPEPTWLRIGPTRQNTPMAANTAAALGELAAIARTTAPLYTAPAAFLERTTVEADDLGVTVTWRFSREGVILPMPLFLGPLGGSLMRVQSPTQRIGMDREDGPVSVSLTPEVRVRFPSRRVPTGRALGLGLATQAPPASVSHVDHLSVVSLGLESLLGTADVATLDLARATSAAYLAEATFVKETHTGQPLPFDAAGNGAVLAAAHAFLNQAITSGRQAGSEANSLLTSLEWRQDWLTWQFWDAHPDDTRRIAAILSLTGPLCPEPERRLRGAMFEASLAAERGLDTWQRRLGRLDRERELLEPFWPLRKVWYSYVGAPETGEDFARLLLSGWRVYGDTAVTVTQAPEQAFSFTWPVARVQPSTLAFASTAMIPFQRQTNVDALTVRYDLGITTLDYAAEVTGPISFLVPPGPGLPPMPAWAPVPVLTEPRIRRDPR